MATQLEKYIPLPDAARRLGLTMKSLNALIDSGIIKAIKLNGDIAVSENELEHTITQEQFEHLRGKAITISLAAQEYGVPPGTIKGWVSRGLIAILADSPSVSVHHGPGRPGMEIDLADLAYCAAVYKAQGGKRGKRLFDEDGQPYRPKFSTWATYQRQRRQKQSRKSP